jgi:Cu/Ag efflux protein CusF
MGLTAFLLLSAAVCAAAEPPGGTVSNLLVGTATVEKIDMATREVTLNREEGEEPVTIIAGPDVRNLDQVRVGDRVTFTVSEELAIFAAPQGGGPSITKTLEDRRTPMGGKPGRSVTNVVETSVTIVALDLATHTAVIREHSGDLRTIRVSDRMNLDGIKVGDQAVMRHTKAMAISVENP